MNNKLNEVFIEKTRYILEKLFMEDATAGRPVLVDGKKLHKWDISGFAAVAGTCTGVIAIRFTEELADRLLEKAKLQGLASHEKWTIINDMVAELVNTLAGNVLTEEGGRDPKLSVPITVTGKDHIIAHPRNIPIVCIPFTISQGCFEIEYSLKLNEPDSP